MLKSEALKNELCIRYCHLYDLFCDLGTKFLQQTMTRFTALILQKKNKTLRELADTPTQETNVYTYAPLSMDLLSKHIQKLSNPHRPSP